MAEHRRHPHAGRVTFAPFGDTRTEVTLAMDWEPEGLVEKAGDALGIVEARAKKDLENFKKFIEERGTATGAWRGQRRQEQHLVALTTAHHVPDLVPRPAPRTPSCTRPGRAPSVWREHGGLDKGSRK